MRYLAVVIALILMLSLTACGTGAPGASALGATIAPAETASAQPPTTAPASASPAPATQTPEASATPSPEATATANAAGPLTEADLVFTLGGEDYELKTDAKPLLEALGDGYALDEAPSCLYDGNDKTFTYDDIVILTFPTDGKDIIDEIDLIGGDYATQRGVGLGDTLDDIKAAYGDNYIDDGGLIKYVLGDPDDLTSPMVYFELTDGKIAFIGLYSASNIQ